MFFWVLFCHRNSAGVSIVRRYWTWTSYQLTLVPELWLQQKWSDIKPKVPSCFSWAVHFRSNYQLMVFFSETKQPRISIQVKLVTVWGSKLLHRVPRCYSFPSSFPQGSHTTLPQQFLPLDFTVSACSFLFDYLSSHFCFFAAHTDHFSSSLFVLIGVILLGPKASLWVLSLFVVPILVCKLASHL